MEAAALAFELAQEAPRQIIGAPLTDYVTNVLKDDGKGLESGLLQQMEDEYCRGLKMWGGIMSELHHRRKNLLKISTPRIGKDCA